MPVRPDVVAGYAKPKAKAKAKAKHRQTLGDVIDATPKAKAKPRPIHLAHGPRAGTQGPARRGASQPKGPVARPSHTKVDTGDITALADAKGQRVLLGERYPSGKQSRAALVVKRSEKTRKRDDALSAFDRAKGTPVQRRSAAIATVRQHAKQADKRTRKHAVVTAPVLNVLDQTTRPLHAIAGSADAAITHKPVGRAFVRGLQNKDRTTFSKPLRHIGVPKGVAAAAGLGLDIVADPTTYVTLGAGAAGRKVVEKAAATKAGKTVRALASDVNPKIAPEGVPKETWAKGTSLAREARATTAASQRKAERHSTAVRKAIGDEDHRKVTDAIEGKAIDTLPAHLQPVARHVKAGLSEVHAAEKAHGVKGGTVREIQPMAVPPKTNAVEESAKNVAKARRARATAERKHRATRQGQAHAQGRAEILSRNVAGSRGEVTAQRSARVVALANARAGKRASPADVLRHIDEVEARGHQYAGGGVGVTQTAHASRAAGAEVKAARKAQAEAEAAHTEVLAAARSDRRLRHVAVEHNLRAAVAPKAYVPHYTVKSLESGVPSEARGSVGRRTVGSGSNKARAKGRAMPLEALRREHPGVYNEDLALAYGNRMMLGGKSIAQAKLNQGLAALGRPFERGVPEPAETEGVFRLHGSDLTEITDKAELRKLADKTGLNKGDDRYVILHRDVVKHAHATASPSDVAGPIMQKFDRATGRFKYWATQPNPGFHVRNLVGDTQNAYLAQPGHRLPGNMVRAGKTLRALKHADEAQRTIGATAKTVKGSVTNVHGETKTYIELARDAEHAGAIRSGFTNRELHDLMHAGREGVEQGMKKVGADTRVKRAGRVVKRTIQSREDLPRLTTYIEGWRRGMTPQQAATHAADFHFDYANLTRFERGARRVVPFYTFSARNIPLQAKMVLKKPGKVANYEKVREEAASAAGMDPNWEDNLKPWEARNAPIPISFHGKKFSVSAGLPIADLNEFPTTLRPDKLVDEWFQKAASLGHPLIKDPVEFWANYSAFFRGPIRRSTAPLVAAPSWVGMWPAPMRKKLGIVKIVDKKTGAKIWAWDAKANYVAHAFPGPWQTGSNLTSGTDQAGRGTREKLLSAAGVKTAPIDPAATKINTLYDEKDRLQTKLGALSQQGIKRPSSTPERNALNLRVREIDRLIYELSRKAGYKVLPTTGRPRVAPTSSGGGIGGGIGGGLGGGL